MEITRNRLGNAKFSPLRGDPKTSKVHPPLVDGVGGALKSSMVHGGGSQLAGGWGFKVTFVLLLRGLTTRTSQWHGQDFMQPKGYQRHHKYPVHPPCTHHHPEQPHCLSVSSAPSHPVTPPVPNSCVSDHRLVIGASVTPKSLGKALRAASHPRRPKPSVAERAKDLIRRRRRPPKDLPSAAACAWVSGEYGDQGRA